MNKISENFKKAFRVFVAPIVAIRAWKRVFSFFSSYEPKDFPLKFSQTPMATMATKFRCHSEMATKVFVAIRI
jgi:hypothetical protein